MKATRSLFILSGDVDIVQEVLKKLQYKGLVSMQHPFTQAEATAIFMHNKSIACSANIPQVKEFHSEPIIIKVVNNIADDTAVNFIDINSPTTVNEQFEKIVKQYNCDIGDHVSNSSGLTTAPSKCDCAYCKLLKGKDTSQKILCQSPNFFIMTTMGAFVEGYLLVIPKEHIMSTAQLNSDELKQEYLQVLELAKALITGVYHTSNIIVFENGTGNSGKGKAKDSVVHAHTHVVISKLTPDAIEKKCGICLQSIHFKELANYSQHSYLLIHEEGDIWKINSDPNTYIPRQFVRQLIAEEHGITDESWNWRTHPYWEKVNATNKKIMQHINNNSSSIFNTVYVRRTRITNTN